MNKKKFLFNKSDIFLGNGIKEGIFPEKQNVKAVTDMPYPTNLKESQGLLGMLNYVG